MAKKSAPVAAPEPVAAPVPALPALLENPWFGAGLCAVAAVLAFHGILQNEFVFFDDDKAILYNQNLVNPSLKGFFTGQNLGMYAPMTWIAYWFGTKLSGQEAWGHHLIGLFLHAANAVLVFAILRHLFKRQWPALFAGLLFAVHPVQAESVAWAAAMSTVVFAFFYLSSLLAYLQWLHKKTSGWLVFSLVLFLAACLGKSAAVTLPLLLVAIDFLFYKKDFGKLWLSKIPYFLISLVFGFYTFRTRAMEGHDIDVASSAFSAIDRFWMVCQTFLFYPVKLLLPFSFSIAYPFAKTGGAWDWTYYAAPLALAGLGVLVWKYVRHKPELLFALALYTLPLLVMLPIRTVGSFELRSDRYVYLSCAGIFLLLGLFLEKLKPEIARYGGLLAITAVVGFLGHLQGQVWKDGISLFRHCVDKTPEAALCQCNLAYNELVRLDFENAVEHYSKTLMLDPTYIEAYNGRGQANFELKKIEPALQDFTQAIRGGLSSPKLFLNKGKCLVMLSKPAEAIPDLTQSIQLEPNSPEAYFFRGFAHEKTGAPDKALLDYSKAIEQKRDYIEPLVNRGLLLSNMHKYEQAIGDYSMAIKLNPGLAIAYNNRANAWLMLGDMEKALVDASKAIEVNPNYLRAYETRMRLYQAMGQTSKAQADAAVVSRMQQPPR